MAKPSPPRLLARSGAVFRQHPWVMLAHGGSLVLGLGAVCCGLGLVVAPWFACELFASHIEAETGHRPVRGVGWLKSGVLLFVAVLVVSSAAWLSTLGFGVDMPVGADAPAGGVAQDLRTVLAGVAGLALALLFLAPFLYAPLILIDRGGSMGGAVLESVRIVAEDGVLAHLGFSVSSHLVQLAPLLVAASLAVVFVDRASVPLFAIAALPLLAVTLPLGQNMVAAAYLERRERVLDPASARPTGRPHPGLVVVHFLLLISPALFLSAAGASLARPSRPRPAPTQATGEVVAWLEEGDQLVVPTTALTVTLRRGVVSVSASDGGGAGPIPAPHEGAAVETVRVERVREAFGLHLSSGGGTYVTWIDRAGVRLDDHLQSRLSQRLPPWGLLAVVLAMLMIPLVQTRALLAFAQVRRAAALEGLSPELGRRAFRVGSLSALVLSPVVAAALVAGVSALFA